MFDWPCYGNEQILYLDQVAKKLGLTELFSVEAVDEIILKSGISSAEHTSRELKLWLPRVMASGIEMQRSYNSVTDAKESLSSLESAVTNLKRQLDKMDVTTLASITRGLMAVRGRGQIPVTPNEPSEHDVFHWCLNLKASLDICGFPLANLTDEGSRTFEGMALKKEKNVYWLCELALIFHYFTGDKPGQSHEFGATLWGRFTKAVFDKLKGQGISFERPLNNQVNEAARLYKSLFSKQRSQ